MVLVGSLLGVGTQRQLILILFNKSTESLVSYTSHNKYGSEGLCQEINTSAFPKVALMKTKYIVHPMPQGALF